MSRGIELDWFTIRIRTIRTVVLVVALGALAALLVVLAQWMLRPPPDEAARRSIRAAEAAREEALGKTGPAASAKEMKLAEGDLDDAKSAYTEEIWDDAIAKAESASERFERMLRAVDQDAAGVAHFLSIDGRVSVQDAGTADFDPAELDAVLFNGDWVKVGHRSSAEFRYVDDTVCSISPDSIVEIHLEHDSRQAVTTLAEGDASLTTGGGATTIVTESGKTFVTGQSKVEIAHRDGQTNVGVVEGQATVTNPGGDEVQLGSREQVSVSEGGTIGDKRALPIAPVPLLPTDRASFDFEDGLTIELRWRKTSDASTVHLQVTRSKDFYDELDADAPGMTGARAVLQAVTAASYRWRVATVEPDGSRSSWSQVRRFTIIGDEPVGQAGDTTPPELVVNSIQQLGRLFIVSGRTEVGAHVTINDDFADVDLDGSFRKTVEARQVGTNRITIVAIDQSGNRVEQVREVVVEDW